MSIDWDATGSMLQGLGSIGSVLAIVYAAWRGTETYENWRNQKVAERRQDHAERILIATYHVRDALKYVRSGVMWGHEIETAKAQLAEEDSNWSMRPQHEMERLAKAQTLLGRLKSLNEIRSALIACAPIAQAHFGSELEKAISELHGQFWSLQVDIESYAHDKGDDIAFSRKLLIAIGERRANAGEADEIGEVIRKSSDKINEICLPALKLET